ncbi:uncharacterized protein K02A2.6-like [Uranotaenia lowii]|uniref:uncharacterized protein K02A2.6-like n=1 Tax=Uranotaenia lowii TaxID=190385 RepID=UPI00247AC80F|nr:uncharacterized protein K02A2.6-like [Uranotaenia lowii]
MTSETTIRVCREFFSTFGIPSVFVSNNGPQFTSAEFAEFLKMSGVVHKLSAPYHPATNGQAERLIQTMKCKLKSMDCNESDLHSELYNILLSYRKMIHPTTEHSPAQMVFGHQLRSRLDLMIPSDDPKDSVVQGKVRELTVGSRVSARNYDHSTIWEFGVIKERLGKSYYLVQLDDGRVWRRHIDQLRAVVVEEQYSSQEILFPIHKTHQNLPLLYLLLYQLATLLETDHQAYKRTKVYVVQQGSSEIHRNWTFDSTE